MHIDTDILIVGSGVGGATIAKELAGSSKKVLVVEKGHSFPETSLGTELRASRFYDKFGFFSKTKEDIYYYRTLMLGGSSVVSCGNGVRSLEVVFLGLGIDLSSEFVETEQELNIQTVPESHIGNATRRIMDASNALGFSMKPMPKYINFSKCVTCGRCVLGCASGSKWTALDYLREAQQQGVSLMTGVDVRNLLIEEGVVRGVAGYSDSHQHIEIYAPIVVLSAGGIGTPIILQNSGIDAGQSLFLDLFNVTVGIIADKGLSREVTMAAVHHNDGFILSPFLDSPMVLSSVLPMAHFFKITRKKGLLKVANIDNVVGIMTKIKDDRVGRVNKDGTIEKTITREDAYKLKKGADISKEILIRVGANPETILTTKVRGAHPGGTAAIGEVVNNNFETKIKGLYVCDASIFPESPGLPPIVTIIALAKHFVQYLRAI